MECKVRHCINLDHRFALMVIMLRRGGRALASALPGAGAAGAAHRVARGRVGAPSRAARNFYFI